MTDVVLGEASESDDEFEKGRKVFALEVTGEATESDEDVYEQSGSGRDPRTTESIYKNNLLQRKLIENNIAIWRSLSNFVKNLVVAASRQLVSTDQMLIKSQVTMQSILSSLKISQTNIKHLHEKTSDIFTTTYIPRINMPK